jgi:hypothetical protein
MHMMRAAILAVTKAIITGIRATVDAVGRTTPGDLTSHAITVAASRGIRRQAMRASGVSHPIGLIRPQYLPALAQSRLLRLRIAHLSAATRHRR